MKGTFRRVKFADLKKNPLRQTSGTPEDNLKVARSWLDRAVHPLVVSSSMHLADGHRRVDGLEQLGETEAEMFVTDDPLSEADLIEIGLVTSIHRANLTPVEEFDAIDRLEKVRGCSQKELAAHLQMSPARLSQTLALRRCIAPVIQALRDSLIVKDDAYQISQLHPDQQPELLDKCLAGASREEIKAARKPKPKQADAVKVSRVTIPLPGGRIVVSAPDLDLDKLISLLTEARALGKTSRDKNHSIKTFAQRAHDEAGGS